MGKQTAIGWLIGYFVAIYPMMYAFNGSINYGLANGIIGILGAIAFEVIGE